VPKIYDLAIIGGSYAGMAAALQLARARRRLIVIDADQRRNRFAESAHGFLGQDGTPPDQIAATAREQLLTYPDVTWREDAVTEVSQVGSLFELALSKSDIVVARRLLLAFGVIDNLPAIPGLQMRWGKSVFHCPYCHGYELNQGRIGVIANGPMSLHQAQMLPDWGTVTLFTNGTLSVDEEQRSLLEARKVVIETERVEAIEDRATVRLLDGRRLVMDGLFTSSRTTPASPIAEGLGCELEESPLGFYIRTDTSKETSVSGVFACGDAALMAGNVSFAVGDGAMAGIAIHRSLIFS
jgi:thioredoxin reductase